MRTIYIVRIQKMLICKNKLLLLRESGLKQE